MVDAAEREGRLAPGGTIIEAHEPGNTGVGLAMIAAARGYRLVLVMPDTMSVERRQLAAAYGAQIERHAGRRGHGRGRGARRGTRRRDAGLHHRRAV